MAKSKKAQEEAKLHIFQGSKMERLQQLYAQWYGCQRCQLGAFRANEDIVFADGDPDAKIMIVGEAPGEEEAGCSVPFVGASGKLLNQILAGTSSNPDILALSREFQVGRKSKEQEAKFHEQILEWRRTEFFITNVVACRPPENRTPVHPEVKACWERLLNIIYIVDPWIIITAGRPAAEALVRKNVEVTKLRGTIFDVEIPGHVAPYHVPVMVTLHPSYLLRQADWNTKSGSFRKTVKDYLNAQKYVDGLKLRHLGIPVPQRPELS